MSRIALHHAGHGSSVRGFFGAVLIAVAAGGCAAPDGDEEEAAWSAADLNAIAVSTADMAGSYDPNGTMRSVQIRDWGGRPMLTATVKYDNFTFSDVDFLLVPLDDGGQPTYVGRSSLDVRYSSVTCSYPIDIVVLTTRSAEGDLQLYVRDNRPTGFLSRLPSGAQSCPPVTNRWVTHPQPYVKRTPIAGFVSMVDDLCDAATARVSAVAGATSLTTAELPASLPRSIYDASGVWQSKSTPARDTKLRGSIKEILTFLQSGTQGSDAAMLSRRLLAAWGERSAACPITYTSSAGAEVSLTLTDLVKRAYALSFDPYHCPELRWGAALDSAEFATCNTQGEAHLARYADEQTLRNYLVRPSSGTPTPIGSGPAIAEDIDFVAYLERTAGEP